MAGLEPIPLSDTLEFNWVFLYEVLVVVILALFFLFYFNRLFATIVSYAIRAYTWSAYRAYIDIEALQISPLGGRIFFKSIKYHAHNVTVYVYEGHITWRYWLRLVSSAEVFQDEDTTNQAQKRASTSSDQEKESAKDDGASKSRERRGSIGKEEKAGGKAKKDLPCRISVKVAGVEAFIYNRSPVYDAVVEATMGKANSNAGTDDNKTNITPSSTSSSEDSGKDKAAKDIGAEAERTDTFTTVGSSPAIDKPSIPAFLHVFPIKIECKRAAAAVGNENTKNVITAKAERSAGFIDAGRAGVLDLWKLLFNFDIQDVVVAMKPNRDFKELQLDAAQRIIRERETETEEPGRPVRATIKNAQSLWCKFTALCRRNKRGSDSLRTSSLADGRSTVNKSGNPPLDQMQGRGQWHGLMRYLDDGEKDEHDEWQQVEYAKASELVNIPKVSFRFFWDMPGLVRDNAFDADPLIGTVYQDDINGAPPPEYGMELGVHGGFVVYGPWADRQRINLQPIFVPAAYVDTTAAQPLRPGQLRVSTIFKIKVLVEEDVVLRIPTREESKDSKWKGRSATPTTPESRGNGTSNERHRHWKRHKHGFRRKGKKGPAVSDARPYGWIDVTVKKDSVVNYNMDMYPRDTGYRNTLDLDVKGLEMSSSVNHGLLWRSGSLTLEADLSQPAPWNTLRKWPFNIVIHDMELFILRDHLFLIIDIVNDWASGAPSDFYTFVPYYYQIGLTFNNFVMYLNVNDANIINDPADFDRNDYLTIEGQLRASLDIPMENYRPKRNQISYDVIAQDLKMVMHSSAKSTLNAFVEDRTMAELPRLTLNGSYNGNQEAQVGNVDVLRFDIVGTGLTLKAFGFYVRQLVNIKENYFGDYLHFKTLEEFQGASDDLMEANAKTASFPKPTSVNELDVILCIVAEDATVLLPTNIYSCKEFVRLELARADLDLRIVSYYLDMGLQLSPISVLTGTASSEDAESPIDQQSNTQFYCRHVELNGHRSFGLPPNEEAYVSQWDIDIGKITGEMSSHFIRDLALAGRAFAFSISDAENATPLVSPAVVLDASFVQVQTDVVRLWFHVAQDAFLLDLEPVKVETSDWASGLFSQRISVIAPLVTLACVDGREASRHRTMKHHKQSVRTYAFLQTGVAIDVVGRKHHFDVETNRQQSHFRLHDQRTNRFPFLVRPEIKAVVDPGDDQKHFEAPAIPYPFPPLPLTRGSMSVKSLARDEPGKSVRSMSSFSSLSASIKSSQPRSASQRPGPLGRVTDRSGSARSASYYSLHAESPAASPARNDYVSEGRLPNDAERARLGLPSSTMAFSSAYTEPYFPLDMVQPDESEIPGFARTRQGDDLQPDVSSVVSELIGDPAADQDLERVTVMVRIVPGLRVYVEPHVAITASQLVEKVLPKEPEEIMDAYQMSVMGDIEAQNAVRNSNSKVLEVRVDLEGAYFRVVALDEDNDHIADQLDMQLRSIETSIRIKSEPTPTGVTQALSLHSMVGGIELEVAEPGGIAKAAATRLSIDDALIWMAFTSSNAFHVSLRETSLAVDGLQARYLSRLALKLIPIVNDIQQRFETILSNDTKRLELLTYVLTHNGEDFGDPPFMARLMYILRAFPQHFRNTDSWKILARFRWILKNLPSEALNDLRSHCMATVMHCPKDAPRLVLDSWNQWRNWDVPYVSQTTAFKILFRDEDGMDLDPSDQKATTVTFRSESLQLVIEHEANRSDFVLEETSLGLENTPPTRPEGLMLVEENTRTKTALQMHTSTIALLLDWSLFMIAEDVLSLKEEIETVSAMLQHQGSRTAGQALEDSLARHDINVVLSTNTGSITLKTVNLRHIARTDGLKVSLMGTTQANEQLGQCMSVILNADTAITELHGPTTRIWQSLLTSASLYVDSLQPKPGINAPPTVTVASAYNKLQIIVSEQVPGILHIIDAIIMDEVAKIYHLVETAQSVRPFSPSHHANPTDSDPPRHDVQSVSPKVHVAVLSGQLHIEVSLLSTLSYLMEGTALSARVAPSLSKDGIFSIDFDVGRQNHAFVNTSSHDSHVQDLLEIPPINGHVGLELSLDETSVSVATTIEKIEVNAGAIQGVMAVLSRPEVEEVMSAINSGIKDIEHHVEEVFPKPEALKPKGETKTKIISYDARLAILGVRISATTPHFTGRSLAEVEFGIGPLHAKASNRDMPEDIIPQVLAHIQDIGASLKIVDRGRARPCGNVTLGMTVQFSSDMENGAMTRELKVRSDGLELNAFPATAAAVIDVINHLQDRIKHLDLSREVEYLRRIRDQRKDTVLQRFSGKEAWSQDQELPFSPEDLLSIKTSVQLTNIQACWIVDPSYAAQPGSQVDDLVFSIESVEFTTRNGHEARLTFVDMQLQLCKKQDIRQGRSLNSALLPEVGFTVGYWTHDKKRNLVFKATGKPLDLRLESRFILPTNALQKSIELAMERSKQGTATWQSTPTTSGAPRSTAKLFDSKHIGSILVEADFAGAQVYMRGCGQRRQTLAHLAAAAQQKHGAQHGRYGQFAAEGALMETTLTAPGIAFKVEYNSHANQPTLNGELMIDASSNMLLPNVVPLILEVSDSVKEVVRDQKPDARPTENSHSPDVAKETVKSPQRFFEEDNIVAVTPAKIFGKTKVDLGFRICKQEFGLSCQPIARVDAKASLEDLYITMNTIDSDEHGHFFAMSAVVTGLAAHVKHVYSRDPTFSYDMDSIVLSAMNNKHLSGNPGVSAILNFNPTRIVVNGKQFQDLLLFREIWLPPEIRNATVAASADPASVTTVSRPDEILVQKYQTVAAAAAFPWNATVSIKALAVDLDLGQSIGKSSFTITNLWASQHKTSTWEQNLCIGMDEMAVRSTGRMSGFIELKKFGVRTSIHWPEENTEDTMRKTPLIQASVGFDALKAKAAFDYQPFAFGDIGDFDFLMYNVREGDGKSDRLVAVLDCGKAFVFCTSTSPAQAVGLYQAFDRLILEKQTAYEQSLKDIEKHLRRESTVVPTRFGPEIPNSPVARKDRKKSTISLHTDVVVTVGAICFGVYPSTFFDSQMVKVEANNIQARFAVGLEQGKITSGLGMTLGQLQVALSSVRRITAVPKALEVTVEEVVNSALNSKGGTILRVPKVIASMQTWQSPDNNSVDYIFKSLFEGKIDVGWNLSRINFIKNMYTSHCRALASRLGKSVPESAAVKITAAPQAEDDSNGEQEKITAEINLPQSRYEYHALEPPVIETPQLRDMGEATPPLEWVGLHRDRLPNVTHQIIIVSLLEVCREVEDAYAKILGSS